MGVTKSELFTDYQNRLAELAKALGHPARIAILEHISQKGACVCGDIVEELPLSQSTVSQHLKAMKEAGILKGEVDGPHKCYCIDTKTCQSFMQLISSMFARANCC